MTLAAGAVFGPPSSFAQQEIVLFAVLRGENEIPNNADLDGNGMAMVSFRGAGLRFMCLTLFVDLIDTPLAGAQGAHIHRGPAKSNGGVEIALTPPATGIGGVPRTCVTITAQQSLDLRTNPADFYVNVHTGAFPGGAIRGQLFGMTFT
jgi:hypothetical protein